MRLTRRIQRLVPEGHQIVVARVQGDQRPRQAAGCFVFRHVGDGDRGGGESLETSRRSVGSAIETDLVAALHDAAVVAEARGAGRERSAGVAGRPVRSLIGA